MFSRHVIRLSLCILLASVLTSCGGIVTALLIRDLLDDSAPKRWWTGIVTDSTGHPIEGLTVQLRAEVFGDDDVLSFSDVTDDAGYYEFKWRYNKEVAYSLRVLNESEVIQEQYLGQVELGDNETNIQLTNSIGVELSGIITDWQGIPLDGVLILGASAEERHGGTDVFVANANIAYDITNDSGVYQISGTVTNYGIICAYHPDYGFAYAYGEDTDGNGSIALSLAMGAPGTYSVAAQVVDNMGVPLESRVLNGDQQFRLRLRLPWNLGSSVDDVVSDHSLFQGLVGNPSTAHPAGETLTVQATGIDGLSETSLDLVGSSYELEVLSILDDTPATALITTDNPLVLHENSVVVVRVNN